MNNHDIRFPPLSYLPIGIYKYFATSPEFSYVVLLPVQHHCILRFATFWVHIPKCSMWVYYYIHGSTNNHSTRFPPHSYLPIVIYKYFATPSGLPYVVLMTVLYHFMLKLATYWVYTSQSCLVVPQRPRLNEQPWYQVSTSFLPSYRYTHMFFDIPWVLICCITNRTLSFQSGVCYLLRLCSKIWYVGTIMSKV